MDASNCETRKALKKVLRAYPGLSVAPRKIVLPDGKSISIQRKNGHKVLIDDGRHHVVVHETEGHISFTAYGPKGHVDAVSRPDGTLQGLDRLPKWAFELLEEIVSYPKSFNK